MLHCWRAAAVMQPGSPAQAESAYCCREMSLLHIAADLLQAPEFVLDL